MSPEEIKQLAAHGFDEKPQMTENGPQIIHESMRRSEDTLRKITRIYLDYKREEITANVAMETIGKAIVTHKLYKEE